jgi:hypothetical protein
MPVVNLPYDIQNGQPLDATKVMADLQAITALVNGSIDADNAATDAPTALTGKDSSEGVLTSLQRSDAQRVIRGVEELAALPTQDNRVGRMFTLTGDSKLYYCTNPAGSGTFIVIGNQAAADLPIHGAQHGVGQHDPIPDNTIARQQLAAAPPMTASLGADVAGISTAGYTNIIDLAVTTVGVQTLLVIVQLKMVNTNGSNKPSVGLRVLDVTAANVAVWANLTHQLGLAGGGSDAASLSYSFLYQVPSGGARTLRLQAGSDVASVDIKKRTGSFNGESFDPKTIAAVVL